MGNEREMERLRKERGEEERRKKSEREKDIARIEGRD